MSTAAPADDRDFMALAAPLAEKVGRRGVEEISATALRISGDHLPAYIGMMQSSAGLLDQLLAVTDRRTALEIFTLAGGVAAGHPAPAVHFLRNSPDLITLMGIEGVRPLAGVIARTIAFRWEEAAHLAEESAAHCRRLLDAADRPYMIAFWSLLVPVADDRDASVLPLVEKGPQVVSGLMQCDQPAALFDLLERLAESHPRVARRILMLSGELTRRYPFEGLRHLAAIAAQAATHHPETAFTIVESAPVLLDRLAGGHPRAVLFELYALAAQVAEGHPELAMRLCAQSPAYLERIGLEGVRTLVRCSLDLGRSSRPAALALWEVGSGLTGRIGLEGLQNLSRSAAPIAAACPQTAAAYILKSPGIIDRLGVGGLWEFAEFCRHMAEAGAGMAARFPEQVLSLLDRLPAAGDPSLVSTLYRLADDLGRHHPMIAHRILDRSPELIDRIGIEGLEKFCTLVRDMAWSSWTATDALIKAATDIIDCIGYEGLTVMAAFSRSISRGNVFAALSLIEKSPLILKQLVQTVGSAPAFAVLAATSDIALADAALAVALLEKSPSILDHTHLDGFTQIAGRCLKMAEQDSPAAVALAETAHGILDETDLETWLQVADFWIEHGPRNNAGTAAMIGKCPAIVESLIAHGGPSLPAGVFRLAGDMARHNFQAALNLLVHSADHVAAAGIEGLHLIAARTMLLSRIDPEKAARFASGQSIAFADFMKHIPQGVQLEEIRPVLSGYLAALLGYRLEIEAGERPSIAAGKITLPGKIREFESDEENFIYYKVLATRLEAHLEYGSYDLDVDQGRRIIDTVREKFGSQRTLEDGGLYDFNRLFPEPAMMEDLIDILEDYRIDRRVHKEYPVLGEQIARMNRHDLKKRPVLARIKNRKQHAVESILQKLMLPVENAPSGAPNDFLGPVAVKAAALQDESAAFLDSLKLAVEFYLLISDRFSEPYRPTAPTPKRVDHQQIDQLIGNFGRTSRRIQDRLQPQKQQPGGANGVETQGQPSEEKPAPARRAPQHRRVPPARRSADAKRPQHSSTAESRDDRAAHLSSEDRSDAESSSGMKFPSAAHIEHLLRMLYKRKGVTPNEVEDKVRQLRPDQIHLLLQQMQSDAGAGAVLEKEAGTRLYGEWDDAAQTYRANWCRVREQVPPEGSRDFYLRTIEKHAGLLKKIRREFRMMRPEEWSRLSRQPAGDDIDLDAAVEYLIDLKIGVSPSENNYLRTEKKVRDIAAAVLVDMSKSTKGTTLRCEKEALVILSEALKEVGDTFGLFGFSGDNRDNVDFYRIKDFDEPYLQPVHKRISAIDFGLENRDGTALRHTIGLLKAREERTRIIILISDGKPVDKEYSGRYAIEDTRKALIEAQKAGIKTFCITVDEKAADYLPRMYSHSNWVVIDDVTRLPEKISRIFARLTSR
jgi:hypothetical protein